MSAIEMRKGVHFVVAFRNPVKARMQQINRAKIAFRNKACSLPCVQFIEFRRVHVSSSRTLACDSR
jgi:beta-lactamase regulating signal transducer with metallopeptidase domain